MRLIDADNYKGKVIANHLFSGVNKLIRIDDVPTVDVNNLIIAELEKELEKIRQESIKLTESNIMAIGTRADGRMDIIDIIDKHLLKLKGEQK